MGNSAGTYVAVFTTQYQLTIAGSPSGDGLVSPTSGGWYNAASSVPISASPTAPHTFVNWTGVPDANDVVNVNSASTSVVMNKPENLTANFH